MYMCAHLYQYRYTHACMNGRVCSALVQFAAINTDMNE